MNDELTVPIGTESCKVFLQEGFYAPAKTEPPLHKHSYAEVHIVSDKALDFKIGDTVHSSADGNLIIIPKDVFHCVINGHPGAYHTAFQTDCGAPDFLAKQIHPHLVTEFSGEIKKCRKTNDYTAVSAYISLFLSQLYPKELPTHPVSDYRFLICEFFSRHYNEDLHLSDLSAALHLSERQTERLILKYTGNTFRQELTARRIGVAKHLLNTTSMPLTEIARYVGYRSYTGFWKAMQKDMHRYAKN